MSRHTCAENAHSSQSDCKRLTAYCRCRQPCLAADPVPMRWQVSAHRPSGVQFQQCCTWSRGRGEDWRLAPLCRLAALAADAAAAPESRLPFLSQWNPAVRQCRGQSMFNTTAYTHSRPAHHQLQLGRAAGSEPAGCAGCCKARLASSRCCQCVSAEPGKKGALGLGRVVRLGQRHGGQLGHRIDFQGDVQEGVDHAAQAAAGPAGDVALQLAPEHLLHDACTACKQYRGQSAVEACALLSLGCTVCTHSQAVRLHWLLDSAAFLL